MMLDETCYHVGPLTPPFGPMWSLGNLSRSTLTNSLSFWCSGSWSVLKNW